MWLKPYFLPFLFLAACSVTDQDKANIEDLEREAPVQEAFKITYIYSDSAVIQAILRAPHVYERTDPETEESFEVFDMGFHLEFLDPNGKVSSEMSANYGEVNLKSGIAEAKDNVVVVNDKGERMETEFLLWDKQRDSIFSYVFTKIFTVDEIIYCDTLVAKSDFSSYETRHIRGIARIEE